ncbi:MAG: carbohydrate ABC transporter permease [Spirochaetaceae bacterium]|nr:carbohydrate ABC transporter permease [Spirochaetaceae bacterium]RKX77269.1 MAG: carbohydrate ABC transporter permease [Spirochaetota bacterium]RKX80821.1 MAG: carbohydrate ABC transporter permease [Spirochaetota bacterium]RKX87117.1 MAG: carbohydrate ABC transporter permease [Spirochaetota bacterium]RKX98784.1 MAG: carbohydrate ABC transporter permease [Spirochaetota bacterium]
MDKRKAGIGHWVVVVTLFVLAVVMVYPLYNQLVISLTGPEYITQADGTTLIPRGFTLSTYTSVLAIPKVYWGLLNSLFITAAGLVVNILLTSIGAYVLIKRNLVGRGFFMIMIVITMIFEGGLIPDYFLMRDLHLLNTYASVILFKAVNPYYLIIMMRFFDQVPKSMLEAARLDGYGDVRILFKIVLPVSVAGIATISLFYGVFHWNEYFRAMIYLSSEHKWPLQVILRELIISMEKASFIGSTNFLQSTGAAAIEFKALKASLIILAIVPILLFYPFVLRYFVKGRLQGAVKE